MSEVTESNPDRWNPDKVTITCISLKEISVDMNYPFCARALASLLIKQYNYYSPGFMFTSLTEAELRELHFLGMRANEELQFLINNKSIDFNNSDLVRYSNVANLIAYAEGSTDINPVQVRNNREALTYMIMFQTICNRNKVKTRFYNYSLEDVTKPLTYGVAPITLVEFAYQINVKKLSLDELAQYVLSGTKLSGEA